MSYDQLVNDFVLDRFREWWNDHDWSTSLLGSAARHAIQHQLVCETSRAEVKRCEWSCGCYSEYTREDVFVVKFIVSCDCGDYYRVVTSLTDLVEDGNVIEQLEEYESTRDCVYDND